MRLIVPLIVITLAAAPLVAAPSPLRISLAFTPQEGVTASNVTLDSAARAIPISITIDDARPGSTMTIGQGTDDDDEPFDIVAAGDPLAFVRDSAGRVFTAWRLPVKDGADRQLHLELREFFVEESNKAVGSTYFATVTFRYELRRGDAVLISGDAEGSSERYGRARSMDNCNEVLSDAMKEALATVLDDDDLQDAWAAGVAAKDEPAPSSIEERLLKLKDLFDRGVITQDEYETRRAEILQEV
jgi:hypothetical protein